MPLLVSAEHLIGPISVQLGSGHSVMSPSFSLSLSHGIDCCNCTDFALVCSCLREMEMRAVRLGELDCHR